MDQEVSFISTSPKKSSWGALVSIMILGVIFPILGLGVELIFRLCAEVFFNPIPTVFHVVLIALVPGLNLWGWLILKKQPDLTLRHYKTLLWGNGFALGISIYYALLFSPISFVSLLLILFFGLGLLGLSPLSSVLGAWIIRRRLTQLKNNEKPGTRIKPWWGMGVAFLLLISLDAPVSMTRIGLSLAGSETVSSHRQGVALLQSMGNREQMLRACYERPGFSVDLIGTLCNIASPVSPEKARRIYYQVTGTTFNSVPPPRLTGRGAWDSEEWFWDEGQGGEKVGTVIKGLSLAGSRLDTSIDPAAAVSYSEWTLTFTNQSSLQHEARAQILLPPGGVVSRLTLWVDGEEREAAFAKRSEVRAAYQKVVRAQRDPVLVTSTGSGRILLQCYPILPNGGTMKVRVGITAPLTLANTLTEGTLFLPTFIERNFSVPEDMKHAVWIESNQKLSSKLKELHQTSGGEGAFALRGSINDPALRQRIGVIAERNPSMAFAFTANSAGQGYITQKIMTGYRSPVKRFIFVIDESAALRQFGVQIPELLANLPDDAEFDLVVASDELRMQRFPPEADRKTAVKAWMKQIRFTGGKDNLPALEKACELAEETQSSVILWVHGPQPIALSTPDTLEQRYERSPGAVRIHEYQVVPGPNLIIEQMGQRMEPVTWSGNFQADISQFLRIWAGKSKVVNLVREEMRTVPNSEAAVQTSKHLARLWANDQVGRLVQSDKQKDREQAVKIAVTFQIVTPVTGAVVLESQAQYQDAGLKPVDPSTVPTVPEPEVYLMLILVALLLGGCHLVGTRGWFKSGLKAVP